MADDDGLTPEERAINKRWEDSFRPICEVAEQIASDLGLPTPLPEGTELQMAARNWLLHRSNTYHHRRQNRYPYGPECTKCCRTSQRLLDAAVDAGLHDPLTLPPYPSSVEVVGQPDKEGK